MKTYHTSTLVAALLAFAATAFGQGTAGSGAASSSNSSTGTSTQPSTGSALRNPSTMPADQTGPSGVGFGTRSTTSPSTTAPGQASTTSGLNAAGTSPTTSASASGSISGSSNADLSSRASSPSLNSFTALDADSDGRISITEFTAGSSSVATQGNLGTNAASGVNSNTAPRTSSDISSVSSNPNLAVTPQTDPTGASSTTTRSPGAGFSGATAPGVSSGATVQSGNSAQLFHQLDTNNDGYLSRSELTASGRNTLTQP